MCQHQHWKDTVILSQQLGLQLQGSSGKRPTRDRAQAPSPTSYRVVITLPTDEVVGEGDEGEDERIQENEVPAQPTPKMINQVLTYLNGLSYQGQTA